MAELIISDDDHGDELRPPFVVRKVREIDVYVLTDNADETKVNVENPF